MHTPACSGAHTERTEVPVRFGPPGVARSRGGERRVHVGADVGGREVLDCCGACIMVRWGTHRAAGDEMSKKKARKKARRQLESMKRSGDFEGIAKLLGLAAMAFVAGAAGAASQARITGVGHQLLRRAKSWGARHGLNSRDDSETNGFSASMTASDR
jgi:hypothetical protein